jgi:hypothetical protein
MLFFLSLKDKIRRNDVDAGGTEGGGGEGRKEAKPEERHEKIFPCRLKQHEQQPQRQQAGAS